MKKILDKLYRRSFSRYYHNQNYDVCNTVLLAGTGRGGTTWLSNIINYNNEYRYIFEPFHPEKVPEASIFRYKQYLRPQLNDRKYYEASNTLLSGNLKNSWADCLNSKFYCSKRLIKDIRINLMLKWIKVNFPQIPIILLLRHPCAVAYSKMKRKWDSNLNWFLCQEKLLEDFLSPFEQELKQAKDDFEKHIFFWCIETLIPLKQISKGDVHLLFYEDLCVNTLEEVERLFLFLNKEINNNVFRKIHTPSAMARKDSAILTGGNLINSWKNQLTASQIGRAVEILKLFNLHNIYCAAPMPCIQYPQTIFSD